MYYMPLIIRFVYICTVVFVVNCSSKETSSIANNDSNDAEEVVTSKADGDDTGKKIVNYASTLLGTPYKEAGRDTAGFDCSGFIYYCFKKYNVEVPHSSRHLAELGNEIQPEQAKPGDLIFFRGTDPNSTQVGHVGIVVTSPGEPVKFIHASSAKTGAHVKYDSLAKPNYTRRFLKVKRLLEE